MSEPYHQDATATVYAGDCLDVLPSLPDNSVDCVVTDPPYGLEFMGKDWDSFGPKNGSAAFTPDADSTKPVKSTFKQGVGTRIGAPKKNPRCKTCGRLAFDHAPRKCNCETPAFDTRTREYAQTFGAWCELWAAECLRILKPGGHMLAFGGTRTWHRLTCAVEDAGFEIRDSIAWLYGSGFPKSRDVSKAIDARGGNPHLAGNIAEAIKAARISRGWTTGQADRHFCGGSTNWTWYEGRKGECRPPTSVDFARIVAEWPELAPLAAKVAAAERQQIGRNPNRRDTSSRTMDDVMGQATGAELITAPATPEAAQWQGWGTALKPAFEPVVVARKPLMGTVAANVLRYGTGALNIDACRINSGDDYHGLSVPQPKGIGGILDPTDSGRSGVAFQPAAGRWPANVCLDEFSAAALDQMSEGLRAGQPSNSGSDQGGGIWGSGGPRETQTYTDAGGASRFFYTAKAGSEERITHNGVSHPTVKPLSLMRWLVRLVCPPGGLILDPFAGSGTTVEAAILEGFRCIAVERGGPPGTDEHEYLPMITQRINRRRDPIAYITAAGEDLGLFADDVGI